MRQAILGTPVPTANLAINKSRIKLYETSGSMPTYYLKSGQEFQIELYNPTSDVILAKIHLNGTAISQGGLVLKPAQRVFLDRYIDIAKKFLFDTYEVSNNAEVRKAIEDNGDFKVEFYRESKPLSAYPVYPSYIYTSNYYNTGYNGLSHINISPAIYTNTGGSSTITLAGNLSCGTTTGSLNINNTTSNANYNNFSDNSQNFLRCSSNEATMDSLSFNEQAYKSEPLRQKKSLLRSAKKIETGRVEAGSNSDQELQFVNKTFDSYPFHTVKYKMLPESQKVNTVEDLAVRRYCTNCSAKAKKEHKFCASCGARL